MTEERILAVIMSVKTSYGPGGLRDFSQNLMLPGNRGNPPGCKSVYLAAYRGVRTRAKLFALLSRQGRYNAIYLLSRLLHLVIGEKEVRGQP